jgi:hypothetical protein
MSERQLSFCPAGGRLFGTGILRQQARKRGAPFGKLLGGQKLGGGRGRNPAVLGFNYGISPTSGKIFLAGS